MPTCPTCGTDLPDHARFCLACGTPQTPDATPRTGGGATTGGGAYIDGDVETGGGDVTGRDRNEAEIIVSGANPRVFIGDAPAATPSLDGAPALERYLQHVLASNCALRLQGIRSGGKLVRIELETIYITLRATRQRARADADWLAEEARRAPGERALGRGLAGPGMGEPRTETVVVSVNEALADEPRLVVLGDPGSGKTTLLRYLALLYARDIAGQGAVVREKLGLDEGGRLPILIPLRRLGAYLKEKHPTDDGLDGHGRLVAHLLAMLKAERLDLAPDFFDPYLEEGQAVVLLDGLDEVADPDLRRRVARMVEAFTAAYPACRYVVTSRVVGYTDAAHLNEGYAVTTVRDFTDDDVAHFLRSWHLAVAEGQMGPGDAADAYAARQTAHLLKAIQGNERIRELAINPLLLTVIALVHRDRVKLPDRRAELYAEAVDVLLGKWDEARGVRAVDVLGDGRPFDAGDKRLLLQGVALAMHEAEAKEIGVERLRRLLGEHFKTFLPDWRAVSRAVDRFLRVAEERTGLLVARGEGVYAFSHLTFQEYLAALAVAARDDYVAYTLAHCGEAWWREVILLEAGALSLLSLERTTRLIRAVADCDDEAAPYHNLVLAAAMLRDVGEGRVVGDLEAEVQRRLWAGIEADVGEEVERLKPRTGLGRWWRQRRGDPVDDHDLVKVVLQRKAETMEALVRAGAGYWTPPYGEPDWVEVPAGEFWMGTRAEAIPALLETYGGDRQWYERETPQHRQAVARFWIARTPVTNAQYQLFIQATGYEPPKDWQDRRPPRDKVSHPVVYVSWHDAMAYCRWLSDVTGRAISLPTEAQWEKAARGDRDRRLFPWGDTFEAARCNSRDLGLGDTTPVGIFPSGASPYGVLDMSGNVVEWCLTAWQATYDGYQAEARAEDDAVLRGGSFYYFDGGLRCAYRYAGHPYYRTVASAFGWCAASPIPLDSETSGLCSSESLRGVWGDPSPHGPPREAGRGAMTTDGDHGR